MLVGDQYGLWAAAQCGAERGARVVLTVGRAPLAVRQADVTGLAVQSDDGVEAGLQFLGVCIDRPTVCIYSCAMTSTRTLITCNCTDCGGRSATVDLAALPAALPRTKAGALTKATTHGLVWNANHPVLGKGFALATAV